MQVSDGVHRVRASKLYLAVKGSKWCLWEFNIFKGGGLGCTLLAYKILISVLKLI